MGATAIGEWLEGKGIKSELSDAGRTAKQMIESLSSLQGSHLIADEGDNPSVEQHGDAGSREGRGR